MEPLVKWVGSKRRTAKHIAQAFGGPTLGGYCEPFLGAGAVFAYRHSAGELRGGPIVLGDCSAALMHLYWQVQVNPDAVVDELGRLEWGPKWRDHYAEMKTRWDERNKHEQAAGAAVMLWLNRAAFNGLWRENRAGRFNVPPASYTTLAKPEKRLVHAWAQALQGVQLVHRDYRVTLGHFWSILDRSSGQVYLDPPYLDTFSGYAGGEKWNFARQVDVAHVAARAAERDTVLASNTADPQLVMLYQALDFETCDVPNFHAVGAASGRRKMVDEALFRRLHAP